MQSDNHHSSESAADAMLCYEHGATDYRGWPLLPSEVLEIAELPLRGPRGAPTYINPKRRQIWIRRLAF